MKITKKDLQRMIKEELAGTVRPAGNQKLKLMIQEEARAIMRVKRKNRHRISEGGGPSGKISVDDLATAIGIAIYEVFQDHKPSADVAHAASERIAGSVDQIFREAFEDGARAAGGHNEPDLGKWPVSQADQAKIDADAGHAAQKAAIDAGTATPYDEEGDYGL